MRSFWTMTEEEKAEYSAEQDQKNLDRAEDALIKITNECLHLGMVYGDDVVGFIRRLAAAESRAQAEARRLGEELTELEELK